MVAAIIILKMIIPKTTNTFDFTTTTVEEVYEIIDKMNSSKTVDTDNMSIYILKEIPELSAKVICHMFNMMVLNKMFPTNLKKARIILLLKQGKQKDQMSSYCRFQTWQQ